MAAWLVGAPNILLLTATPHMGRDFPYYCLWRLLAPDALTTFDAFEAFPEAQHRRHIIRRTKEEMVHFDGRPLYPPAPLRYPELRPEPAGTGTLRSDDAVHRRDLQQGGDTEPLGRASCHERVPALPHQFDICTDALVRVPDRPSG